jgi:hypothetical protein
MDNQERVVAAATIDLPDGSRVQLTALGSHEHVQAADWLYWVRDRIQQYGGQPPDRRASNSEVARVPFQCNTCDWGHSTPAYVPVTSGQFACRQCHTTFETDGTNVWHQGSAAPRDLIVLWEQEGRLA